MDDLEKTLSSFSPISLKEMDKVALMNRVDTKFVVSFNDLPLILDELRADYKTLEIDGLRIHPYKTSYFDTEGFLCLGNIKMANLIGIRLDNVSIF